MTIFRCRPRGSMQLTWWTSTTVPPTATTTPSTTLWTRSRRSLCKRLGTWLWRLYDEVSARVAQPALEADAARRLGNGSFFCAAQLKRDSLGGHMLVQLAAMLLLGPLVHSPTRATGAEPGLLCSFSFITPSGFPPLIAPGSFCT